MVSLFPKETWRERPNGLRKDLVQLLADMKPGFIRFPGGCIVEGRRLDGRYHWKTTIGEIAERKALVNRWNDEFQHRPAPDYYPVVRAGILRILPACRGRRRRAAADRQLRHGVPVQFEPRLRAARRVRIRYVQDALDLIEFANGPVDEPHGASCARRWGIRRRST